MNGAEIFGLLRLVCALTGIGINVSVALLMRRYRRRLRGESLTQFEYGTLRLARRTGAVRMGEHIGFIVLALHLIAVPSVYSWASVLVVLIQCGVVANDVQVALETRRSVTTVTG